MKVLLIVVQGKPEGKTIPLVGPTFRIGRDATCHLRPSSDQVSRQHAEIAMSETEAVIRDLGSRNGTLVNGRIITGPARLKSGDLVKVGHLTFAVVIQGVPEGAQGEVAPMKPAAVKSLDDVDQSQIESWLIADDARPVPDRPSAVYDGDTLTIDAYKEGVASRGSSQPPTPPPPPSSTPPPPAAEPAKSEAPKPAQPAAEKKGDNNRTLASQVDDLLNAEDFEHLPEGQGDAAEHHDDEGGRNQAEGDEDEANDEIPEEMIDESNPFYVAKKVKPEEAEASKASYKDSSDAASDILRKMLDRRRAGR